MYRSVLVSFVLVVVAGPIACKGSARSTSGTSSNTTDTTAVAPAGAQAAPTSDTTGAVAGPIPTTQTAAPGSASGAGATNNASPSTAANNPSVNAIVASNTSSSAPANSAKPNSTAWPGNPNPNRVPNEMGRIMVLEYHLITDHNSLYARERGQFRKDLEFLYDRGYRPVNMSDVLDKNLNLPKGLSPVVFVFDDASPEQLRYIDNNGKLEIDPQSGMGIWLDFRKTHPDWNNKSVYCLLSGAAAGHNFFGDRGVQGQKSNWRFQKVRWLADNGFELCNHTLWHMQLSKYPDAAVQQQIAQCALAIDSAVPGYRVRSMALPQGLWPKNRALASHGSWTNPKTGKTTTYNYEVVFEVAGGPMRSPYDPAFNPGSTPRIQVIGNAIEQTVARLEQANNAYISDGNPSVVARPATSTATTSAVRR
jgi:peptidoglycan/xylan/chitin deacetylase (PgdA/CDA1 family)